jgi:hypothetical protein
MSSIYQLEVALICRSNNKLSSDALYLYMVKTYDLAVAYFQHKANQIRCTHTPLTTHHTPRPFWLEQQDRSEPQ